MFLEKYARLKSDVMTQGKSFSITVSDDELENKDPIMWLEAHVTDTGYLFDEEDSKPVVKVYEINFNDSTFFKLPQERQDAAGVVVLKKFITYYKQNFDGHLISTSFANYELQEKFKDACEKGIFPKESLNYIDQTTKEDYEQNTTYNKNNRKKEYEYKENPKVVFTEFEFEDNLIKNEKLTTINSAFIKAYNDYGFLSDVIFNISGRFENDNVYYEPPKTGLYLEDSYDGFYFNGSSNMLFFRQLSSTMDQLVKENYNALKNYIDVPNIEIYWRENGTTEIETLDKLLLQCEQQRQASTNKNRLRRRG